VFFELAKRAPQMKVARDDPPSELATKGYLCVENFLVEDSYKILVANLTKIWWFEPLKFPQNGKRCYSSLRWDEETKRFDSQFFKTPQFSKFTHNYGQKPFRITSKKFAKIILSEQTFHCY